MPRTWSRSFSPFVLFLIISRIWSVVFIVFPVVWAVPFMRALTFRRRAHQTCPVGRLRYAFQQHANKFMVTVSTYLPISRNQGMCPPFPQSCQGWKKEKNLFLATLVSVTKFVFDGTAWARPETIDFFRHNNPDTINEEGFLSIFAHYLL